MTLAFGVKETFQEHIVHGCVICMKDAYKMSATQEKMGEVLQSSRAEEGEEQGGS